MRILSSLILVSLLAVSAASGQGVESGFTPLFDGKTLNGWAGRPNHWTVEDSAITGASTAENPAKGNNFLIARNGSENRVVKDFELRLSYRFLTPVGNSGIQYRSVDKGNFVVNGYQADMEAGTNYTGILYEEGGRGILALRGQKVKLAEDPDKPGKVKIQQVGSLSTPAEIQARIKPGDWNDYVIIVRGNHIQHFVNGLQTVDVVDEQASKAASSGILALQIHQGPPMKIQFRNIRIKEL